MLEVSLSQDQPFHDKTPFEQGVLLLVSLLVRSLADTVRINYEAGHPFRWLYSSLSTFNRFHPLVGLPAETRQTRHASPQIAAF